MIAHAKTIKSYWTSTRTLDHATTSERDAFKFDEIENRARLFRGYNPKILESDMFRMVFGYLATLGNKSYLIVLDTNGDFQKIRLTPKHL